MLATGEYEAVELFSRLAAGLALNGAPIDLVAAATRVATDEIRHADYAFRMAALCDGQDDVVIDVRTRRAETRWGQKLDLGTLDLMMIEIPAVGEALACALIGASHARASDPVARALFTSILGDEVHHTRLGWYYLAWRAPQWTQAERQRAADRAGEVVVDVERRFWWGRDAPAGSRKAARALGILESEGQREVIRDVMEREIVPALDQLGLGRRTHGRLASVASDGHPFPPFAWHTLDRPLAAVERSELARSLRDLLRFQRDLTPFGLARLTTRAPKATAFVSVYSEGRLRGCYGSHEGGPAERVARAFLRAAHDTRFGGVAANERDALVAQISYVGRPRLLNPETAVDENRGRDARRRARSRSRAGRAPLAPRGARRAPWARRTARRPGAQGGAGTTRLDRRRAVSIRDAGRRRSSRTALEATPRRPPEVLGCRPHERRGCMAGVPGGPSGPCDLRPRCALAAAHCRRRDAPRAGGGRGQALAALGARSGLVARARRRLRGDIRAALGGTVVEGWPSDPERVAGTLALAIRAGLPLHAELVAFLAARPALETPWHAAQVVAALGPLVPRELWTLCVRISDRRPFAPWTLIAADVLGDASVRARTARSIANAIRSEDSSPRRRGHHIAPGRSLSLPWRSRRSPGIGPPLRARRSCGVVPSLRAPSSWATGSTARSVPPQPLERFQRLR